MIKYWLKVTRTDERKYIKAIYKQMLNDINENKENWASKVKYILNSFGFSYVWMNQGVENINAFIKVFKQRVKDIFIQNRDADLSQTSKTKTYILIKSFDFKMYLVNIKIKKYRFVLTKFRLSSHQLEIETGRGKQPVKTPTSDRKCKLLHFDAKAADDF